MGGCVSTDVKRFSRSRAMCSLDSLDWCSQTSLSLFAFPVPKLVPLDYVPGTKLQLPDCMGRQTAVKQERNLVPGRTASQRFFRHFASVLSCKHMLQSCDPGGSRQHPCLFRLTRTIFCVFAWNSYFIQLCFPVFTVVAVIMVVTKDSYCSLHLGKCILLSYGDTDTEDDDADL